ncbi:MAG: transglutaminase domain-containing protein [Actinobacteria bacterium]|nr:transglutaminase domain-containing protein [Actinomycetota bacterium]
MTQTYVAQSPVTDPGAFAWWVAELPGDVASLRRASSQLVFHYWADGEFAANGIPPERGREVDTRYVDDILGILHDRSAAPLSEPRSPSERFVGCCRDFAALFVSFARAHGIPARSRVGFSGYFVDGWWLDHVVAEVWDDEQHRWRLVEAQVPADYRDVVTGDVLPVMDVPRDRFLTGGLAWRAARAGRLDPERFVVNPQLEEAALRSWSYLAHNLVLDLAALGRREMILWDEYGVLTGPLRDTDLQVLDELAAGTSDDVDSDLVGSWLHIDPFRVPEQLTSYSPRSGPRQVTLRPGLAS